MIVLNAVNAPAFAKKIITIFALSVIVSLALVMTISSYYAKKITQKTRETS
tara:strand:- start:258 stop:410 length:153 start_codon:yes stop_codon:yes gene_type:complete